MGVQAVMKRSVLAVALVVAACTSDAPKTAEDSAVAERARVDSAIEEARRAVVPPGESPSVPVVPAPARKADEWEITPEGIGSLKAGMSLDEARVVMHNNLVVPAKLEECGYVTVRDAPAGLAIMVEKDVISRVEVRSGKVATIEGARIGDSEEKIKSLYPGMVAVQPHKYTDGHYLVVTPKDAGENRIVFETDGKKVLRFRSGRRPAVEYVEGCS
jgi:hypothetical protein